MKHTSVDKLPQIVCPFANVPQDLAIEKKSANRDWACPFRFGSSNLASKWALIRQIFMPSMDHQGQSLPFSFHLGERDIKGTYQFERP